MQRPPDRADWFAVAPGTEHLHLGDRAILVQAGVAAELPTMVPHALAGHDGPVEILVILSGGAECSHLHRHT